MDIELRHLRAICAIAETGSVTKAAANLGLAQPALTAQLQRIERALGGPLFERDRRGARPTPLGELVLARARVLLPAVKGLQDEAARLVGGTGTLSRYRIGATNGPIMGGLVHRLAEEYPHALISTYATWSADELCELVLAGRLDFAIVGVCGDSTPAARYGLTWGAVCVDAVCALLSETHPLARHTEVDLAELAEMQWVVAPGDGCFASCFAAACARAGFTPRGIYETDVLGGLDLVEAGAAVALCQATFRQVPGMVKIPLAGAPLRWRHLLGWHPDAITAEDADRLLSHATAAYLETVSRSPQYVEWLRQNPRFGSQRVVLGDATAVATT